MQTPKFPAPAPAGGGFSLVPDQLTPWLYVMPSVQYVIRPGGTGSIPNALVLGAEIGVTF